MSEWVACSCCGASIRNDAENNVSFGEVPYPDDTGMGMCVQCGGDKSIQTLDGNDESLTVEQIKRKIGWASVCFFETRFEILEKKLSPENAAKFKAMTYARKIQVVTRLIEKGTMI